MLQLKSFQISLVREYDNKIRGMYLSGEVVAEDSSDIEEEAIL